MKVRREERAFQWKDRPPDAAGAGADAGPRDADGDVGLAGPGPADQHEIALLGEEGAAGEVARQRLVHRGLGEVERRDLLREGHPGDGHLVLDRVRLLLGQLGGEQVAHDAARGSCWRFTAAATISS